MYIPKLETLTKTELIKEISARNSWIESLRMSLPYADHDVYSQDLNTIRRYQEEIDELQRHLKFPGLNIMPNFNIADYDYLNQPILIDLIMGFNLKIVKIFRQPTYTFFEFDNDDGITAEISDNFHDFILSVTINNKANWELFLEKGGKVSMKGYSGGYKFKYTFTILEIIKLFMKKKLVKMGIKYLMDCDGYLVIIRP